MNQTLEATAQAIFKEWFVNFNFPGFDGELVHDLPKGWTEVSFERFWENNLRQNTLKKAVDEYFEENICFKNSDMHNSVL